MTRIVAFLLLLWPCAAWAQAPADVCARTPAYFGCYGTAVPARSHTLPVVTPSGPRNAAIGDVLGAIQPSDLTAALSGATITPAGSRPVALQDRFRLAVADYCAPSALDGATNHTACVQAAVTAFCNLTKGGGVLQLPAGTLTITASVGISIPCQGVTVAGVGWGNRDDATAGTKILVSGTGSAPILNFTGTSLDTDGRNAEGGGVRDLMFISANSPSAVVQTGAMVAFSHCLGCIVDRVYSFGAFRFATAFAGLNYRFTNLEVTQLVPGGEGIKASGSDAGCGGDIGNCHGRMDIITIDHSIFDAAFAPAGSNTATCMHASDFVGTMQVQNVTCNQTSVGLNIDCPTSATLSACPQFITAFDLENEANGINNPAAAASIVASDVVHLHCTGCQFFGYTVDNNVKLLSGRFAGAGDVQFIGGRFQSARGDCITSSVGGLQVIGAKILDCNQSNGGAVGIRLAPNSGGAAYGGNNTIMGNQFCYETIFGNAPHLMGGIVLLPGVDWTLVHSNIFRGCNAAIGDTSGAGATHNSFIGNVGP